MLGEGLAGAPYVDPIELGHVLGVAALERLEDQPVLDHGELQPVRLDRDDHPVALAGLPEAADDRHRPRHPRGLEQRRVEGAVVDQVADRVVFLRGRLRGFVDAPRLGELLVGDPARGLGDHHRLDRLPQQVDLEQLERVERGDPGADVALERHQPLALERPHVLANGDPADAELLRDRVLLLDPLVRGQPALEDRPAEVAGDRRGPRLALHRLRHAQPIGSRQSARCQPIHVAK